MSGAHDSWASSLVTRALGNSSTLPDHIWWQSHAFGAMIHKMLPSVRHGQRNLTVTTLGGSSSAFQPNYGTHLSRELQDELGKGRVRLVNPSHGYTGSDWAALYLDSLVPPDTDILLWEFAINDWPGAGPASRLDPSWPGLRSIEWHKAAFDLFLRRVSSWALRRPAPRATPHGRAPLAVGAVMLWQPQASYCWPHCRTCRACPRGLAANETVTCPWRTTITPHFDWRECKDDGLLWRDHIELLEQHMHHASEHAHATSGGGIDATFALNANELLKYVHLLGGEDDGNGGGGAAAPTEEQAGAKRVGMSARGSRVFRDLHHPTPSAHEAIGKALYAQILDAQNAEVLAQLSARMASARAPGALGIITPRADELQTQAQHQHQHQHQHHEPPVLQLLERASTFNPPPPSPGVSSGVLHLGLSLTTKEDTHDGARGRPLHTRAANAPSTQLLELVSGARVATHSYFYGEPRHGDVTLMPSSAASLATVQTGHVMAERIDNVMHVNIPVCGEQITDAALSYAIRPASGPNARDLHMRLVFVGLNLRAEGGAVRLGALDGLHHALTVSVTLADGAPQPLVPVAKSLLDNGMSALCRGVFAPQAWWLPAQSASAESTAPSGQDPQWRGDENMSVHVCRRLPVRARSYDSAGTARDALSNAVAVGGVVIGVTSK